MYSNISLINIIKISLSKLSGRKISYDNPIYRDNIAIIGITLLGVGLVTHLTANETMDIMIYGVDRTWSTIRTPFLEIHFMTLYTKFIIMPIHSSITNTSLNR